MSRQTSSFDLGLELRNLTLSPFDDQLALGNTAASPAASAEGTAVTLAWQNARDTYRKSLSDKDFKRITIPAQPEDVLQEIEKWQSRQGKSKYRRVADGVQAGLSQLQKFNRAIDMIAQGSPAPGCLLWGSIIFVLTVSILLFVIDERLLWDLTYLRSI